MTRIPTLLHTHTNTHVHTFTNTEPFHEPSAKVISLVTFCPGAGMVVTNVFKLEHPFLLRRFQKASAATTGEGSKVKGLFCSLPAKCLPRVAAFGQYWYSLCSYGASVTTCLILTSVFVVQRCRVCVLYFLLLMCRVSRVQLWGLCWCRVTTRRRDTGRAGHGVLWNHRCRQFVE